MSSDDCLGGHETEKTMGDLLNDLQWEEDEQKDEENAALFVMVDADRYKLLAHTGPYFQFCDDASLSDEDIGIETDPIAVADIVPGYYVLEKGEIVWDSGDWFNEPEWNGIKGVTRKATREDFERFNVPFPFD